VSGEIWQRVKLKSEHLEMDTFKRSCGHYWPHYKYHSVEGSLNTLYKGVCINVWFIIKFIATLSPVLVCSGLHNETLQTVVQLIFSILECESQDSGVTGWDPPPQPPSRSVFASPFQCIWCRYVSFPGSEDVIHARQATSELHWPCLAFLWGHQSCWIRTSPLWPY
jgi:hypothetical protein